MLQVLLLDLYSCEKDKVQGTLVGNWGGITFPQLPSPLYDYREGLTLTCL